MNWQPMDSAPRDGSRILVCDQYGVPLFASWWAGGWRCQRELPQWEPSYWLPLPKAPNHII